MTNNTRIVNSPQDLKRAIKLILNDMWVLRKPKFKKIVYEIDGKEKTIAELMRGNFIVNWDSLIKVKQIFKNQNKK